ncbi:IS21-like element helper ATPase IstB [Ferribacterium limneticum]|uniref:IS21-like element helper ATPase IstB n=1 Tax=Ferribacterium limneticum TaxID=76259 RepID=UPI001CFABE19|nr:IS21-like element helper ATPase IstB [Ferribacterium limneticum]UCV28161.1 IS21-like element helper ATPase IstB [Ferribacterium limneticum]UCV32078.1 IS21-like element helper ATPase IstB [Ferribacterium limneticum]
MSTAQQTLNRLRQLKLGGMADAYELQLDQPKLHGTSFDDRLAMLVDHEMSNRDTRRIQRLLRGTGFPESAALEDIDDRAGRGVEKSLLATLAGCQWIYRHQNLVILGATGVGKTWLGCALGTQACRLGISVLYYRCSQLFSDIAVAMADGSIATLKSRLVKPALLMIDDFGNGEMNLAVGHILLDVIDRRMRCGSLLITSQYPRTQWHGLFPDPTLADAVLDRVVHQSHQMHLKGESMRKMLAKERMATE